MLARGDLREQLQGNLGVGGLRREQCLDDVQAALALVEPEARAADDGLDIPVEVAPAAPPLRDGIQSALPGGECNPYPIGPTASS